MASSRLSSIEFEGNTDGGGIEIGGHRGEPPPRVRTPKES